MEEQNINNTNNSAQSQKIELSKTMYVSEIIARWPNLVDPLMSLGMHCISCFASQMETLEEAAMVHGLDADEIIEELKEFIHQDEVQNGQN
jgi:hybrid cluster-associated redox disulfide protein